MLFFEGDGGAGGGSGGSGAGAGGSGEGGAGSGGDGKDTGDGKGKTAGELKYTDEQVNAMMARAGQEQVTKLLKEHGLESTGKLKEDLKALKDFRDAQKTETEKLSEGKTAAEKRAAEADARATKAEAKAEALALGVPKEALDDFVTILSATESKDGETIAQKAARVLESRPHFKGAGPDAPNLGGRSKSQAKPEVQKATESFEAALGLRPTK